MLSALRRFRSLLGLVSGLMVALASAQRPDHSHNLASYRARAYTSDDGLISDSLLHVSRLQDGRVLIVGVRGEPLLFDGHRFSALTRRSGQRFPGTGAMATLQTADGSIWVAGLRGGLQLLREGVLQQIPLPDDARPFSISATRDRKRLLVPTGAGVFALDPEATTPVPVRIVGAEVAATAALEDLQGQLWIGGHDGLYLLREGVVERVADSRLEHVHIWTLYLDRFGRVLIGTRGLGLGVVEPGACSGTDCTIRLLGREQGLPHEVVRGITESDDALWIATAGGGVARYDEHGFSVFNTSAGLSSDTVTSITADARGVLWATTAGAGLNRLWPSAFTNLTDAAGRRGGFHYAVHRDAAGQLWFGSNQGLARYQNGSMLALGGPGPGQAATVLGMIDATDGGLLLASRRGVFDYRADRGFRPLPEAQDLVAPALWSSPRFGRLVASGRRLWRHTVQGLELLLELPETVNQINTLGDDPGFGLLLGTSTGLWAWDGREARLLGPDKRMVGGFWRDRDRLYVSGRGLAVLDEHGWHPLSGLSEDDPPALYAIVPDQVGGVWMSSRDGLQRFERSALHRALDPASLPEPTWFSLADGLPSTEFEGSPQGVLSDSDGSLWFASTGGITRLDPAQVGRAPDRLQLSLHEISTEDGRFAPVPELELPAGTRRVGLSFAALPASHAASVQLRYRLQPVETGFRSDRGQREAVYGGLGPGSYVLELQGEIPGLNPVQARAIYRFQIRPSWLQRPLVQALLAAAVLALLAAVPAWHIRALRGQRQRLIAAVADKTAALERLARTDGLTGLDNRRAFDEQLQLALVTTAAQGLHCGLVLLDVDHFKRYNDALGHQAGDVCLRAVARALQQVAAEHQASAARVGGEEFAVLQQPSELRALSRLADRLHQAVAGLGLVHPGAASGQVSISLGAALALPGESADALLRRADEALYDAKHAGRDRWLLAGRAELGH